MGLQESTARTRDIGATLRGVREAAGLSGAALAHRMGWSASMVSRIETGRKYASPAEVATDLGFCRVGSGPLRERLLRLATDEPTSTRWLEPLETGPSDAVSTVLLHERLAAQITVYDPVAVPGPLRARQRALTHTRIRAFIPESALRIPHGDTAARQAQQRQLVLLDRHSLHIMPGTPPPVPAFELMTFPEFAALVVVQTPTAILFSEHSADVQAYQDIVAQLDSVALPDDQSRDLIRRLVDEESGDLYHHHHPADLVATATEMER